MPVNSGISFGTRLSNPTSRTDLTGYCNGGITSKCDRPDKVELNTLSAHLNLRVYDEKPQGRKLGNYVFFIFFVTGVIKYYPLHAP